MYLLLIVFINGSDIGNDNLSLIKLCITLKKVGVNNVCLTQTNVNWRRNYIISKFRKLLMGVWPNNISNYMYI